MTAQPTPMPPANGYAVGELVDVTYKERAAAMAALASWVLYTPSTKLLAAVETDREFMRLAEAAQRADEAYEEAYKIFEATLLSDGSGPAPEPRRIS
jgi:hypothetical protein